MTFTGKLGAKQRAQVRYTEHRLHTRQLLEEAASRAVWRRVDVSSISEDLLRRAVRDWSTHPNRQVHWDWETQIMAPHWRAGVRGLDLAILVDGQLCGLMVAKLSRNKRWLSMTHLEGSPIPDHPLKGLILPLAVQAMGIFRSQLYEDGGHEKTGLRILNPLDDVVPYYASAGHKPVIGDKRLTQIVIEWPRGEKNESTPAQDAGCSFPTDPEQPESRPS